MKKSSLELHYSPVKMNGKKGVLLAKDDCLVVMVLQRVLIGYTRRFPSQLKHWKEELATIDGYLFFEQNRIPRRLHANLAQCLQAAVKKVVKHISKEKYSTVKALAVLTILNDTLVEGGYIENHEKVTEMFDRITSQLYCDLGITNKQGEVINEEAQDKELEKIIASAHKQAPKMLSLMRKMGYY